MRTRVSIAACSCVLGAGCGQVSPPPAQAPAAAAAPAPAASAPSQTPAPWTPSGDVATASFAGLTGPRPVTWQEQRPGGSMRVAEFIVPGRDGNNQAHVVVFSFPPGEGGAVEANITRWQQQFKPDDQGSPVVPIVGRLEGAKLPVTLVELAGEWKQMGAQWYTADQLFIGAIVEAPRGMVVVRFAGQSATVEANREAFMSFLAGLAEQ